MTLKRALQLTGLPFIAMMLWGAWGGIWYGWWVSAPITWTIVAFIIAGAQSVTLLNVYRIIIRKDDPDV